MTSGQKTSTTVTWDYQTVRMLIRECLKPKFIEFGLGPSSVDDNEDLLALGILDSFGIVELIADRAVGPPSALEPVVRAQRRRPR